MREDGVMAVGEHECRKIELAINNRPSDPVDQNPCPFPGRRPRGKASARRSARELKRLSRDILPGVHRLQYALALRAHVCVGVATENEPQWPLAALRRALAAHDIDEEFHRASGVAALVSRDCREARHARFAHSVVRRNVSVDCRGVCVYALCAERSGGDDEDAYAKWLQFGRVRLADGVYCGFRCGIEAGGLRKQEALVIAGGVGEVCVLTEASARHADREPRMTTVPERRSRMCGRTAFVTFSTPNKFVWNWVSAASDLSRWSAGQSSRSSEETLGNCLTRR